MTESLVVKFENSDGKTLTIETVLVSDIILLSGRNARDLSLHFGQDWRTSPLWIMNCQYGNKQGISYSLCADEQRFRGR